MSCYFVAQIKIHDEDEYKKYLASAGEVFKRFNGEYLAIDNSPKVLEGQWDYGRLVLIEFPNEGDLRKWYESAEYQEILKHRLAAAQCDTLIVRGFI